MRTGCSPLFLFKTWEEICDILGFVGATPGDVQILLLVLPSGVIFYSWFCTLRLLLRLLVGNMGWPLLRQVLYLLYYLSSLSSQDCARHSFTAFPLEIPSHQKSPSMLVMWLTPPEIIWSQARLAPTAHLCTSRSSDSHTHETELLSCLHKWPTT